MLRFCAALLILLGLAGAAQADNTTGPSNRVLCNKVAVLAAGQTSLTQVVALISGQAISVCGWSVTNTAAAGTFSLSYGTGTNCATSTTTIIPALNITSTAPSTDHVTDAWFSVPVSNALCVTPSVATIAFVIYYAQF